MVTAVIVCNGYTHLMQKQYFEKCSEESWLVSFPPLNLCVYPNVACCTGFIDSGK